MVLEQKYADNPYFRHHHLPVFPCDAHPDNGVQLFLQDGLQLPKPSYVKTEWRYRIGWGLLEDYRGSETGFRLHPVSYRDLMLHLRTPFVHELPPSSPCSERRAGEFDIGSTGLDVAPPDADEVNHTCMHARRIEFEEANNNMLSVKATCSLPIIRIGDDIHFLCVSTLLHVSCKDDLDRSVTSDWGWVEKRAMDQFMPRQRDLVLRLKDHV